MAIPKGFIPIEEHEDYNIEDLRPSIGNSITETRVPDGFVYESERVEELRVAPDQSLLNKALSFFQDESKMRTRAQTVYAISEATGMSMKDVNDNYDALRLSKNITGIQPDVTNEQMTQLIMLPAIATAAVAAPYATVAGLITFGTLDKLIPTKKLIEGLEKQGVRDEVTDTLKFVDFVGKALITHGIIKGAPKVAEIFTKDKIVKYNLPRKMTLEPAQVRDIYQTGKLTTAEQKQMFASLGLDSVDTRAALNNGVTIEIPSEKIVNIVDKPYWSKVKGLFGVKSSEAISTTSMAGRTSGGVSPKGFIEGAVTETMAEKVARVNPVEKITKLLKEAKPKLSAKQVAQRAERAKRFEKLREVSKVAYGREGFYKELSTLKGELTTDEIDAIENSITQEDVDLLFQQIRETRKITELEKINAMKGLDKLLKGEAGTIPAPKELELLNIVYGEEFTEAVLSNRPKLDKLYEFSLNLINAPRSLMSSGDFSGALRQGGFFLPKAKQYVPAFKEMFKYWKSVDGFNELMDSIINDPMYLTSRDAGLSLTGTGKFFSDREEAFLSNLPEKLPILGEKFIKPSERAYVGFLNKLRFDVFKDLVQNAELAGLEEGKRDEIIRGFATFVNNATGRGTLPKGLRNSAALLNGLFFSPRFIMSRVYMLNPASYITTPPEARKEMLKSLFAYLSVGIGVLTMLKLSGSDVGTDPTSTDYGKIKVGNTRFDIWSGFQPYIVLAARLATGETSSISGKRSKLGEGYKATTRLDIISRFFENKLAPFPKLFVDLARGKDFEGEPIDLKNRAVEMMTPLLLQDIVDVYKENPKLVPAAIASGVFGVGVQTYKQKPVKI